MRATSARMCLAGGLCMIAITAPAAEKRFSGGGTGTAEDPYRIATVRQLQQMQLDLKAHYRLVEDIDASETADWNDGAGFEPIGDEKAGFSGTLDGAGHVVIGLSVRRPARDLVGLFGHVLHGRLTRIRVLGARVVGLDNVGILAGRNSDQFQYHLITRQCSTSGTVQGRRQVGGLVGQIYDAQMQDCCSTARVTGELRTGGLVGYVSFSQIRRCYAAGDVCGKKAAGGLTGGVDGHPAVWAKIENCFAVGPVEAAGQEVGGLNGAVTRENQFIHWIASYHADAVHDSPYGKREQNASAFQGNRTHPVFATWDFGGVWRLVADPAALPALARAAGPAAASSQVAVAVAADGKRPAAARRVATLPDARRVDAVKALAGRPGELLICTENVGAQCGGGTAATMWKLVLDPVTGAARSLDRKQSLDQIQQVRQFIFEASDGTLFTGGGWCGFKPPYYSTDRGESWRPATKGTYPPNSTFCFAEFNGKVYAGTGYEPHHAQVYRWLGEGAWERVLDIEPPRSILRTMVAFEDRLFVGSEIYWANAERIGVPVYVSADGKRFEAVEGIPHTHSVDALLAGGGKLHALTRGPAGREFYRWTGRRWEPWCKFAVETSARPEISRTGTIYVAGSMGGRQAVFASRNGGRSWEEVAALDSPVPLSLDICGDRLYVGTVADADNKGYVYEVDISAWQRPDAGVRAESLLASVRMEVTDITIDHAAVEEQVRGRFTVRNVGPAFDIPNGVVNPGYGVFILDAGGTVLFRNFGGISGPFTEGYEVTVTFDTHSNHLGETGEQPFLVPKPGTYIAQVWFYRAPDRASTLCGLSAPFTVK